MSVRRTQQSELLHVKRAHPVPGSSPVRDAIANGHAYTVSASEWIEFLSASAGDLALLFQGSISKSYVVIEDGELVAYTRWATGAVSGPRSTNEAKIAASLEDVTPTVVPKRESPWDS